MTDAQTQTIYAGAEWLKHSLKIESMSPLGEAVADLLGELVFGIYHIDARRLLAVDWSCNHHIIISLHLNGFSTYDYNTLTRLVFLAHHMAIRVEVNPCNFNYIELMFHQRERNGNISQRHPTLAQAVQMFSESVTIPEVK